MKIKQIGILILLASVVFLGCPPEPDPELITITFISNGGSAVAPITIEKDTSMGDKYPIPTRAGHTFNGWRNGGTTYTRDTVIDKDITLTANWSVNAVQVTITFDSNGGSAVSSVQINQGSSMGGNFPANPTKAGFIFDGW